MPLGKRHRHTDNRNRAREKRQSNIEKKREEKREKRISKLKDRKENIKDATEKQVPIRFEDRHKPIDCIPQDFTFDKELESFFIDQNVSKILITTDISSSIETKEFARDLKDLFPNSTCIPREGTDLLKFVVSGAIERSYTHIAVVHESLGVPITMSFIKLPNGPTLQFQLSSIKTCEQLLPKIKGKNGKKKKANPSHRVPCHFPELILNNMNTRLGKGIGKFFISMFPVAPEFKYRQVVTFHNQRDFIFVRRHKYLFDDDGNSARMQEIGPSFTMKLKALYMVTFGFADAKPIWEWKTHGVISKELTI